MNFERAVDALKELQRRLFDAQIFRPFIPKPPQQECFVPVETSNAQIIANAIIKEEIMKAILHINELFPDNCRLSTRYVTEEEWRVLRGALRIYIEVPELRGAAGKEMKLALDLLTTIDVNKSLGPHMVSQHLKELFPMKADEWSSQLEQFQEEYAPSLLRLEEELRNLNSNARVLVFVETRENARLLMIRLTYMFPSLNCEKVVGHGGVDGMEWSNTAGQEEVIRKFRSGHCKVLITTSVLEEGIDVQQCDLVIRMGGGFSLIQLIQMRGRARAESGRLLVILSEKERDQVLKLQSDERMMDSVIETVCQTSKLSNPQVVTAAEQEAINNLLSSPELKESAAKYQWDRREHAHALTMYVTGEVDPKFVGQWLTDAMKQFHARVTRAEVRPRSAARALSSLPLLLDDIDSAILVSIETTDPYIDFCKRLATEWDFRLGQSVVWMNLSTTSMHAAASPSEHARRCDGTIRIHDLKSFSVGNLIDKQSFVQGKVLYSKTEGEIPYSMVEVCYGNCLRIIAINEEEDRECVIEVSLQTLTSFAMVTGDRRLGFESITLFIPYRSTPKVMFMDHRCLLRERIHVGYRPISLPDAKIMAEHLKYLAMYPVMKLEFSIECWEEISQVFGDGCCLGVSAFMARVTTTNGFAMEDRRDVTDLLDDRLASHRRLYWELAILKTNNFMLPLFPDAVKYIFEIVYETMKDSGGVSVNYVIMALERFQSLLLRGSPWLKARRLFSETLEIARKELQRAPEADTLTAHASKEYASIDRMYVTASRLICRPAVAVKTNRLLRTFRDNHFVYVSFRGESVQEISIDSLRERFLEILMNGFTILGKHFEFVCASNSQVRSQTAIFVAGDTELVRRIRSELWPDITQNDQNFPKVAKCLALFCTADTEKEIMKPEKCLEIDDNRARNGRLLTDGAALIDADYLKKICNPSTVAVQFRLSGLKGVALVMKSLQRESGYLIQYRKSTKKCETPHDMFCVVKEAEFIPMRLNRDALTIMFSISDKLRKLSQGNICWEVAHAVYELQEEELKRASQLLLKRDVAIKILGSYVDMNFVKCCGEDMLVEPFWLSLLQLCYHHRVRQLRTKTQIPVQQAAVLMGVPDPTGTLKDNEVFIQIRRSSNSTTVQEEEEKVEVITGPVLLYRNPCLHPGDLRLVTAVDVECLHDYMNVVILPNQHEQCEVSLADSCSGGDLDGDEYSCIWDQRFVPAPSAIESPMDYGSVAADMEKVEPPSSLQDFYMRSMCNRALGQIANAHLALCDMEDDGAMNPNAITLAKLQSIAVDSPKTGLIPAIPKEIKKMIDKYPDFMEKTTKQTYISERPLGVLFRRWLCIHLHELHRN